ncbi:hypothetical protein CHR56_15915 [Rhizobium leguminosarum bv. viciae]|nr:hypothetical protein CHR56_15915 [Rhizobium leguminosarum bv. viciae]
MSGFAVFAMMLSSQIESPSLGKGVPPPDILEPLEKRKRQRKLRSPPCKFVQANVRTSQERSSAADTLPTQPVQPMFQKDRRND